MNEEQEKEQERLQKEYHQKMQVKGKQHLENCYKEKFLRLEPGDTVTHIVGTGKGEKHFDLTVSSIDYQFDIIHLYESDCTYHLDGTGRDYQDNSRIIKKGMVVEEAQFSVRVKNDYINLHLPLFPKLEVVEPGKYLIKDVPAVIEMAKKNEAWYLEEEVEVTGHLTVWRTESELIHQGVIRDVLYERQYRFWKEEDREEKKNALIHFSAASLQMKYPHLAFTPYCYDLAVDEIRLADGVERDMLPTKHLNVNTKDGFLILFFGSVRMSTQDHSGFSMILDQEDLVAFRKNMEYASKNGGPLYLVVSN